MPSGTMWSQLGVGDLKSVWSILFFSGSSGRGGKTFLFYVEGVTLASDKMSHGVFVIGLTGV
jgi:hypothetical protein